MVERIKTYVNVIAEHQDDGKTKPLFLTFHGKQYEIDYIREVRRAATMKAGGTGIRYTIQICGKTSYLYDEENGKWFVEEKVGCPMR